ncbi:MAG TPA: BrnT family toxin [Methylocystis sp.]|nr:BrnT family toxin [Methylocystis sp.]
MDIEFDSAKDRANIAKHGLSLSEARRFDWDNALVVEDASESYGEPRFRALGFVGGGLHMMAFTMRSETIRVISLRKATRGEWKRWSQE